MEIPNLAYLPFTVFTILTRLTTSFFTYALTTFFIPFAIGVVDDGGQAEQQQEGEKGDFHFKELTVTSKERTKRTEETEASQTISTCRLKNANWPRCCRNRGFYTKPSQRRAMQQDAIH